MKKNKYTINKKKGGDFGCYFIKGEKAVDLLLQLDFRIDIMERVSNDFKSIDGINLIELWRNLYAEIEKMWLEDKNMPMITLNKLQEMKLNVICDIVAQFFLYNDSKADDEFLKNVGDLFKDINAKYKTMSTIDRWIILKKAIAQHN